MNSSFWWPMTPTHTLDTAPDDIEVLLVPGGLGSIYPDVKPHVEFIKTKYSKLRYLLSVFTASGVLALSRVLDGRSATTNKEAQGLVTAMGEDVLCRSPARWVVYGNIWSSSGVSFFLPHPFTFFLFCGWQMLIKGSRSPLART